MALKLYQTDWKADLVLAKWWNVLAEAGDLTHFSIGMERLSRFLAWFQNPTQLWYDEDESGINFALWWEPQSNTAAWVHMWIAPHLRPTKHALANVLNALAHALEQYPVLLASTKSAAVAKEHEKVGFVKLGIVPYIFDGEPAHVTYLTREAFVEANQKQLNRLERKRG